MQASLSWCVGAARKTCGPFFSWLGAQDGSVDRWKTHPSLNSTERPSLMFAECMVSSDGLLFLCPPECFLPGLRLGRPSILAQRLLGGTLLVQFGPFLLPVFRGPSGEDSACRKPSFVGLICELSPDIIVQPCIKLGRKPQLMFARGKALQEKN